METSKTLITCFLFWAFAAGLCAASSRFHDGKNFYFYYTPYPVTAVPPPTDVSYGNPPPAGASDPPVVSYGYPPPAQPDNPPPAQPDNPPPAVSYQNPPPVQDNNPPSGGGSTTPVHHRHGHHHHHHHHGQKPPTNCDIPPSGGSQNPSPSPPGAGSYDNPPSSGGGTPIAPSMPPVVVNPPIAYHNPPPASGGCNCGNPPSSTPTGPVVAPAPSEHQNPPPTPPTGYNYPPPVQSNTPRSKDPSTTPRSKHPSTTPPVTDDSFPSPPAFPNIPLIGGTCNFWRTHPQLLSDIFRWWSNTIGRAFGLGGIPGIGSFMNLQDALSNTGTDGISALYREGTAAFLNSMVNINFPFTTTHVRDSFLAALSSNKAAAAQAEVFKLANEGHFKPRA